MLLFITLHRINIQEFIFFVNYMLKRFSLYTHMFTYISVDIYIYKLMYIFDMFAPFL